MKKLLALFLAIATLLAAPTSVALASEPVVEITVSAVVVGIPEGFTVTYINDYEVEISWTKPVSANNTMIRAKFGGYPESREDGYLVYYGPSSNFTDTAVNFYDYVGKVYWAAWTENMTGGWSPMPARAELEGPAVIDLVEQVTVFNDFMTTFAGQIIGFLVLASIVALAYWHRDRLLYVLAGLALLGYGAIQFGQNMYIGLILIVLGVYNFLKAAWDTRRRT